MIEELWAYKNRMYRVLRFHCIVQNKTLGSSAVHGKMFLETILTKNLLTLKAACQQSNGWIYMTCPHTVLSGIRRPTNNLWFTHFFSEAFPLQHWIFGYFRLFKCLLIPLTPVCELDIYVQSFSSWQTLNFIHF